MKKRKTRAQRSRSFRCPHCGAAMILRPASEIYHDAKSDRKLYVCHNYPACNTYVAAHPNTDKPMGVPANGDLRNLRIQAHRKFDLIWKNGIMTREEAYRWFADSFGLTRIIGRCRATCREVMNSSLVITRRSARSIIMWHSSTRISPASFQHISLIRDIVFFCTSKVVL